MGYHTISSLGYYNLIGKQTVYRAQFQGSRERFSEVVY